MKLKVAWALSMGWIAWLPLACLDEGRAAEALVAQVPAPSAPLTGPAAWSRIVGNTVAGSTPDGPYTESFAAEGSLRILDRDGRAGGRWALRDGALCTTVDDEDEECRSIEVDGAAGAFVDAAGTRYPFTILPRDSKGP